MQNKVSSDKGINKVNLVLSIVIAFAAWVYVVYSINPTVSKTYTDIPLTVTNARDLAKSDLAVSKMDMEKINVTVRGRRSSINELEKSDIEATVDAANAGKGENALAVQVKVPNGITIKSQSENNVAVTVEDLEAAIAPISFDSWYAIARNAPMHTSSPSSKALFSTVRKSLVPVYENTPAS